ncbi:MAG: hypothetical protein ACI89X_002732 [Planctomycetota bacterium]|jgi:uncharacterized protein YegL
MKALHMALLVCSLLAPLTGQRPKTVEAAITGFEKVRDQEERNRHRAVRDLGRFADADSTTILIAELQRAESLSYQETVIRAIGFKQRTDAVPSLVMMLNGAKNPRIADAAADAMRRQGAPGVSALVAALPKSKGKRKLRNAICYALGRVATGAEARDALLAEIQHTSGGDRLAALRGLGARKGDDQVDAVRIELVGAKNRALAGTALKQLAKHDHPGTPELAVQFARSLPATGDGDHHAAVVSGLLVQIEPGHYGVLLTAASRALDPFGEHDADGWQRAFASGELTQWLLATAPKQKSVDERVVAARALTFAPAAQRERASTTLRKLLLQRDAAVVRAAATSLTMVDPSEVTQAALAAVLKKGHELTSPIALDALHVMRREQAAWHDQLLQLSKHRRATIRTAALRALCSTKANPEQLLEAAKNNLRDRDWQVRAAAISLVVATRSTESPPLLFSMLDKEAARMKEDVRTALRDLTGLQFGTLSEWQKWWTKEGATFKPRNALAGLPGRDGDKQTVSYWNIPVRSDRVTFIVDVSGSMAKPFGTGSGTRLAEAKRQLADVLDRLPKKAKINIVTFGGDAKSLFPKLQALGKKQRKTADAHIEETFAKGPTNVHDALEAAFQDRDVDTIFLLTDGRPSAGPVVEPTALADEVARWNVSRSIVIHTIAIGEKSAFLARLAKDAGGEHSVAR